MTMHAHARSPNPTQTAAGLETITIAKGGPFGHHQGTVLGSHDPGGYIGAPILGPTPLGALLASLQGPRALHA